MHLVIRVWSHCPLCAIGEQLGFFSKEAAGDFCNSYVIDSFAICGIVCDAFSVYST
jgi:hypothetical protein